ncbi:hypothetical protein DFH08DRAFT_1073097 [Mycena albidolilacea]|uniref:MYND-type domain-containing protein n=1 Tax=Mycena albidolilacea TaxID=1033008 RepID=A0AAD7AP00_9AGAR|nr:hypothetical protein DFH08DRAFT_1073097 [Mycena albidolilacea]
MSEYIPDRDALSMASAEAGIAHIRAGLQEKRAFTKEAKQCCDHCKKQETSASPLQACNTQLREQDEILRYCSRDCQLAHYKTTHKKACASFADPPLCRAFNTTFCLPGCSYPETPIFARGVSEGMGAWVSMAGSITCRLATLPAHQFKNLKPEDPRTLMLRTPGLVDGKYLSMRILVQNRTKGTPMVVIGKGIVAVASARGTPIILEGKDAGEPSTMLEYPHLGRVLGLAKGGAEVTHFNGKSLEKRDLKSCPAVKDAHACAVLLNVGDHAMFIIDFRAGGPRITHDFEALELLEHLLPEAADRDEVCEVRGRVDQGAVEAWYRDYKTKGEMAYIASHYGEARAQMVGDGNRAMGEMMKVLASVGLDTKGPNVG